MRHDIDRVILLAFSRQLLFRQFPGFLDRRDRNLMRLLHRLKIFRLRHEINRVAMRHAEKIERDEERNRKAIPQRALHVLLFLKTETVHVFLRFVNVPRFHDRNDDAAFLRRRFRRIIAFRPLIERHILRITARARKTHIRFLFERNTLNRIDFLRPRQPRFIRIAADHFANLSLRIQHGMDKETRLYHIRRFLHIIAHHIIRKLRAPRLRIHTGAECIRQRMAMILLHRIPTGDPRQNQFPPAAVAREKMRRDPIHQNDPIRFDHVPIQPHRRPDLRIAHVDQLILIATVVLHQTNATAHLLAHRADILLRRMRAMRPLRENNHLILIRDPGRIQLIHDMNHKIRRMIPRTRHIRAHETHLLTRLYNLRQRL